MDFIFLLDQENRSTFLQHILNSFACTYICLWSHFPQPSFNCLIYMDGVYQDENLQLPSSSAGSLVRRLFDEYRKSVFMVENGRFPGHAFKNEDPYIELNELNLLPLVSNKAQLQFYQEARIKTAVFMGCNSGEIELGTSNDAQVNLEAEMRKWFPTDFSRQQLPREIPQLPDRNQHSSTSSSLRSLSMDSPEPAPYLFNIPNTPYIPEIPIDSSSLRPKPNGSSTIQTPSQIRNLNLPTIESEDAAMTQAILAVLSNSSPCSSSSSHQPQQATAFKTYMSALAPTTQISTKTGKQNILKRAIKFFTNLNLRRSPQQFQATRSTSNQLHHMISERKRREKLNESFQALKSLLPHGTKRDKASVLASTTEYLSSLKAQVEELTRRTQILESQLPKLEDTDKETNGSSSERVDVKITERGESTSESRTVDLRVTVIGEGNLHDLVIVIMEFLKSLRNVSLINVDADSRMVEANSVNRVILRLNIEGGEWDQSAFQEAVRRVVDDMAK